ncbi:hypothetical protein D9619_002892 [Psilocybe cf. subviscida]|uniref:LYR motif-containing protein Cup1-like N-terminal domain-containing protein n=1 Tax=Psilocybe cf. subviscida TaxID=2480587 RepID=A0A8H5AY03_9AGAR|nr:hypothetical protein D9619_002892 [Psilocybe cf. subviscida]
MPITALYRDYLRNARRLPTLYLRQFFEIRARDNVERVINSSDRSLRHRKLKTVARELRRLKAANSKDTKAFERILSLAYGRVGKLRWELLNPILTDPSSPPPAPLVPSDPNTTPPTFSPELSKLLMTPSPRMKRAWSPQEFTVPRLMPNRFDPTHPDAVILGRPFNKRREHNLRWRWYTSELRRVQPPVALQLGSIDGPGKVKDMQWENSGEEIATVRAEGEPGSELIRPLGLQGAGVLKGLMDVVGPRTATRPPLTRRERKTATPEEVAAATPPPQHPSRWVRRRFRSLLASMHLLVYVGGIKDLRDGAKQKNPFVTTASPLAFGGDARIPEADSTSLAWIGDSNKDDSNPKNESASNKPTHKVKSSNSKPRPLSGPAPPVNNNITPPS